MLLGSEAITQALRDGAIVCDPAPAHVESAHIDVTIGSRFWVVPQDLGEHELDLMTADPTCWFEPQRAVMYGDAIVIPPRGFVLAHTAERIGTAPDSGLLPTLHTRSTLARWGLGLHPSAGWGDVGYCSHWTLEIVNPHPVAVRIPVGARVGCVAFWRVEGGAVPYQAGYNAAPDAWTPASMLPRKGNW